LAYQPIHAQDKPEVTIGGALRFNYNISWKEGQNVVVIFYMMFFASMLKQNIRELNQC
jgi:hypothetical protein